ncbi:conserved hypothetical protein [Vibrio chagasii]|nr:conserved hypothetical protein [Vibrio chagasii]CAH6900016.1 conserved hypothetical protein [Vibrio chagasii]CAH7146452.1 conserved hypothetical protein [Vibrio chagasii]
MFHVFYSLRVKKSDLIIATVISTLTLTHSIVSNRVFLDPYKEGEVYYSSYSYDGRHGSDGRGLSYSIIHNEIDGSDYKVQGFDFRRLSNKLNNYGTQRFDEREIEGIKVGLVSGLNENIYYVVYVEFNQQVILESRYSIKTLNENNFNNFIFGFISSIFIFFFIIITNSLINPSK